MRDHAVALARAAGLAIEFIQRRNFRKEDRVAQVLARRGAQPGLVQVFSAMEPCPAFPALARQGQRAQRRQTHQGKCLISIFTCP